MLKESEWNTINQILLELYVIDSFDMLTKKVMRVIEMLIPYTKGWFLMLDDDQNIDDKMSYFVGFDEDAIEKYVHKFYQEDYIKYLYDLSSETVVYRDTDILTNELRSNTGFYRSYLKSEDIIYGCGIMIMYQRKIIGFFNLFRNEKYGDFCEKDLYILEILKKHLENITQRVMQTCRFNSFVQNNLQDFAEAYHLTRREEKILTLIHEGFSNQRIAEELFISVSTVKKHVYNIFGKTNVSNRNQLLSLFFNWTGKKIELR